jgi:hypothetical protein
MTATKEFAKLKAISVRPKVGEDRWFGAATDATKFLIENAGASDVLLYASMPCAFIHGVFAPAQQVTPPDIDDLLRAHFDPDDSWFIQRSWGGGEGHRIYLEPPMASPGCNSLVGSEKIIFRRSFSGLNGFRAPTELSQKLVHALGLHFVEERRAYCRLNDEGDLEDVITVFEEDSDDPFDSVRAVFISSQDLAQYLALSETVLFRKFDFTRTKAGSFNGWNQDSQKSHRAPDLSYNYGFGGCASYANGYQIARTTLTVEQLVEEWKTSEDRSNKSYETFKILDWKNEEMVECSASPDSLSNYFTKSEKPFTTSPAFFRAEVLHKYKADPEKYTVEHRSITCRNSWYLKTYDINEEGQVHTYIGYLGDLPYSEQQYWKLYNEWPKGPISARAYQTDFEGNFSTEPDPLVELEHAIEELERTKPSWWSVRAGAARPKVLYPATTSSKEWADEILALDQLLVEGFYTKGLKALATKAGIRLDPQWASLRIIEGCLASTGIGADDAKEIVAPLRELHYLRSKVKSHATAERKALEVAAQRDHGSLRAHFTDLTQRCAYAFAKIAPVLQSLS